MGCSLLFESARSNAARREASNLSIAERREERRGCQDCTGCIWGERKRERRWRDLDWASWEDAERVDRMMWGGSLDARG